MPTLLHQTHTFWLWTDPHQTHTQRSPKARSPTACTHVTTRSQTDHTQMDVKPAHLNRDSFRDSFKGLVALEIILDLPVGFPINNLISQFYMWWPPWCHFQFGRNFLPVHVWRKLWPREWGVPTVWTHSVFDSAQKLLLYLSRAHDTQHRTDALRGSCGSRRPWCQVL